MTPDETARRVAVLLPTGFPQLATYLLPSDMERPEPGTRLAVPFGTRILTGLVAPGEAAPAPSGTTEREVLSLLDERPFLPESFVGLLLRASAYYFAPPGELLRAAVPGRLLDLGQASYVPTSRSVGAAAPGRQGPRTSWRSSWRPGEPRSSSSPNGSEAAVSRRRSGPSWTKAS